MKKEPEQKIVRKEEMSALLLGKEYEDIFPAEVDNSKLGLLKRIPFPENGFDTVRRFLDKEEPMYFATYWTKARFDTFEYKEVYEVQNAKYVFENDLDFSFVIDVCESYDKLCVKSVYTEAYLFLWGEDFEPITCEMSRGGKSEFLLSIGLPFALYVRAETEKDKR